MGFCPDFSISPSIAATMLLLCVACGTSTSSDDVSDKSCSSLQCGGNTHCDDSTGEAMCVCDSNFAGATCDECIAGYEGDACDQEIDECQSSPCKNTGICTDLVAAFSCECSDDWTGPTCELPAGSLPVTDTGQLACYDARARVDCFDGSMPIGEDGTYIGAAMRYVDNGDGTITDSNTGLRWQRDPAGDTPYSNIEAVRLAATGACASGWRLPTIKELYSLIDFSGTDPSGSDGGNQAGWKPFINAAFTFEYGSNGDRDIDSQYPSSNEVSSGVFGGQAAVFGLNFADGRIKGYPKSQGVGDKLYTVMFVCGQEGYAVNDYVDQGDGTILDKTTGLVWMRVDSGHASVSTDVAGTTRGNGSLDWPEALAFCEDLTYAGYNDWRLPDAHELQSIVEYSRTPDTTSSPAIDPVFESTSMVNEADQADWPYVWTSTTHTTSNGSGGSAVYISFGRAMGYWEGTWLDVHGAGAQRSDPKVGDPADYPTGHGPQGDAIRIYNYARCVRAGDRFLDTGACGTDDADSDTVCDWRDVCPSSDDTVDTDGDWIPDGCDPCPGLSPVAGVDDDGDGVCNEADNCPDDSNPDQADADHDGVGDLCDPGGAAECTAVDQDCSASAQCPPDAGAGCGCKMSLQSDIVCMPLCALPADCPAGGGTMTCSPEGFCVPA